MNVTKITVELSYEFPGEMDETAKKEITNYIVENSPELQSLLDEGWLVRTHM